MMTEKPKIQYIGQFYVPGSEAQVLAPKKKKKKAKTKLPIAKQEQVKAIYIDPVALIGITVAVVMLAVMVWEHCSCAATGRSMSRCPITSPG